MKFWYESTTQLGLLRFPGSGVPVLENTTIVIMVNLQEKRTFIQAHNRRMRFSTFEFRSNGIITGL